MKILRFGSQKKQKGHEPKTVYADEITAWDTGKMEQVDQLISELKEENRKPQETTVEFRQRPPKVKEWSEMIDTHDEEGNETMARLHHIRLQENFADSVLCGEKSFELRRNDRGYQKGDLIEFEVVNSVGVPVEDHELNSRRYKITYVLSGWGMQDGFVALAIREVKNDEAVQ